MSKEIKICLPVYKIVYSIAFVLILSLVRGITYISEIGIAMEAPIALLTIVFCADTYLMEVQSKRREVFHLYDIKKKTGVMIKRLSVQITYLYCISMIGYGFFYFQKPIASDGNSSWAVFGVFLIAIIGTILFWGILSMTISNWTCNVWAGIGGTLFIWISLSSQAGERLLGKWNVFSFLFREIDKINDWSWMCGKILSLLSAAIMIAVIPFILKKRG